MKLKKWRSALAKRSYRTVILVVVLLLLTSGLGYRFYRQPKLAVGKIAPQTIAAPAAASIEDAEATQEKRRSVRRGILPAVSVDPEANQRIQQTLQQRLERGNAIREVSGGFPFTQTSILSTPVQIYLRQSPEAEWQDVQQIVLRPGREQSATHQSAFRRLNAMQQKAVNELQRYRQTFSSQAFTLLLELLIEARRRYTAALLTLTVSPASEDDFRYDPAFLNLSDTNRQETQIEIQQTLKRILTQGIYPGLSESRLQQTIAVQVQASIPTAARPLAVQLLSTTLSPNLVRNPERTRQLIEQAVQAIEPALITVDQGEVIVRAGEEITPTDFARSIERYSRNVSQSAVQILLALAADRGVNGRHPHRTGGRGRRICDRSGSRLAGKTADEAGDWHFLADYCRQFNDGFSGLCGNVSLDWHLMISFIFVVSLGTLPGAYLSRFVPAQKLQKAFGYFLLAVAAFVLVQNRQSLQTSRSATQLNFQVGVECEGLSYSFTSRQSSTSST